MSKQMSGGKHTTQCATSVVDKATSTHDATIVVAAAMITQLLRSGSEVAAALLHNAHRYCPAPRCLHWSLQTVLYVVDLALS